MTSARFSDSVARPIMGEGPNGAFVRGCWVLVLCLVVAPLRARAEDPRHPDRPRAPLRDIDAAEAAFTGVLSASILAAALAPGPETQTPAWRGGVLFDDAMRDAFVLRSARDRDLAADISDGLLIGLATAPALFDAVVMGWLVRGDAELMARMLLIDLQAHAFAQGVTTLLKRTVRRERPLARGCREDPERRANDPDCEGQQNPGIAPESFFSGHTSLAFTSAALVCLHHTELGLFGPEGDAATCATGMAMASAVGMLRILSDRHYATDVLLGAGVGILSGWLVPWLLHYDVLDAPQIGLRGTIAPMVEEDRLGAQIFGTF